MLRREPRWTMKDWMSLAMGATVIAVALPAH
jgi:hypothetical protein